jgi:hypothetical protein
MPGWLASISASAYPKRSIEGTYDSKCQIGHKHPFVLTGLALLGVTAPGVGVLNALPDIKALFTASAANVEFRATTGDEISDAEVDLLYPPRTRAEAQRRQAIAAAASKPADDDEDYRAIFGDD